LAGKTEFWQVRAQKWQVGRTNWQVREFFYKIYETKKVSSFNFISSLLAERIKWSVPHDKKKDPASCRIQKKSIKGGYGREN
jgi:hypothetical protein